MAIYSQGIEMSSAIALSSSRIGQGLVSLEKRLAQRATLRERILSLEKRLAQRATLRERILN
ncbi:hypothetical protein [Moorena sp. SIO1F2]|uniref:hypothetical protein n=1 Tax=Moorena sp. SIO1F2 TaxID=2607819 RepID=UPI0025DEFF97|nr:hypothetical protein [Moorena sp. SIO1F2]